MALLLPTYVLGMSFRSILFKLLYLEQNQNEELASYSAVTDFFMFQPSENLLRGVMDFLECERPTRLSADLLTLITTHPHRCLVTQSRRCLHKDISIVLGMLDRVELDVKSPQVIYLCPTDDFALEVFDLVKVIGLHTGISSAVLDPYSRHEQALNSQIVIGTWSSFHVLVTKARLQIHNIKMLVIDELDYSLLQNTEEDKNQTIEFIASMNVQQVLVFYAAYCNSVSEAVPQLISGALVNSYFANPEEWALTNVKQFKILLPESEPSNQKIDILVSGIMPHIDRNRKDMQIIIFIVEKGDQKRVFDALSEDDWDVCSPSLARESEKAACLYEFTSGRASNVLLTSEWLPRGYDVSTPKVMIFMDVPLTSKGEPDYHTYRYFTSKVGLDGNGVAWTLIQGAKEQAALDEIERRIDMTIEQVEDVGFHEAFQEAAL